MIDLMEQLYYLIDENLPTHEYADAAERALQATLSLPQQELFEAYLREAFIKEEAER